MYNVVIVDDEKIIREGIALAIDWKAFGCDLIGMAEDGLEGWELIKNSQADIAFLDIKMPSLTGIQLVEKIYEAKQPTKAIIISGYAEFNYAKECMRYGVKHYLLKPAGVEEIEAALRACIGELPARADMCSCSRSTLTAIKFIEDNLSSPELTLGFLSSGVLGINRDYFGKLFKRETGQHFTQYVVARRIEKAKCLLAEGNLKINEIARRVGFLNDEPYFSRVFKRFAGMTPQSYRNSHWKIQ
ncbi:MAG: response regulator [Clostridiales bacterium]|jgi:two-component system response regulator YesN|nr:response regulator [Clostridiales bacterium]